MILQSFGLRNIPENPTFPFTLDLIKNLETVEFKKNITFFVGENGSGKSTILEALAYAADIPTAGGMPIEDDPYMQSARDLGKMLSVRFTEKTHTGFFTRAEDFFGFVKNIISQIKALDDEMAEMKANWTGGDIEKALAPIKEERKAFTDRYSENLDAMSHGEGFLKFFMARITRKGLYLIDEPEAALSPQRQLSLISLILQKVKEVDAQFIIATHSPIIMAIPDATILEFKEGKISPVAYHDTEHYRLSKQFLDAPEAFLEHL
jgi:predicted ATPase